MSYEWPLGKASEDVGSASPASSASPNFYELVRQIRGGDALEAFARRRSGQILNSGHTPETDLDKAPGYLARQAKGSLGAFLDIIGPYRMNMPPERRRDCIKHVEAAGALLIALWDRLQIEVPEE